MEVPQSFLGKYHRNGGFSSQLRPLSFKLLRFNLWLHAGYPGYPDKLKTATCSTTLWAHVNLLAFVQKMWYIYTSYEYGNMMQYVVVLYTIWDLWFLSREDFDSQSHQLWTQEIKKLAELPWQVLRKLHPWSSILKMPTGQRGWNRTYRYNDINILTQHPTSYSLSRSWFPIGPMGVLL